MIAQATTALTKLKLIWIDNNIKKREKEVDRRRNVKTLLKSGPGWTLSA